jgi:hypothetical protein
MSKIASIHLRRLAVAGIAAVALAGSLSVARAAVNPDAFSSLEGAPKALFNIGKSIFYDERINTSTSGLVQVLLIDGSTFTVGPGSDLVIDKFVYNPKKNSGEMVATFSKGVMRFVGGKLSKNEGGVTVNTPQGALAIRGGMFMGQITVRTEDTIRQQDHRRERAALATLLWHSADRPLPRSALHQGALLQRSARRYC